MIIELSGILDLAQVWLAVAFVVFLRVGAAMALFPAVGERSIPVRIRLALAIVFTLLILPSVAPTIPNGGKDPGSLVLSEVVAGLITGSLVRVFVFALEMAGAMTAQVTSLSQIFGGLNADPHPAIGQVLFISGLALAMMLGL
ncbi:MAG: type III secretion protein, partial [Deltaproteobacteria bacterium]